MNKKVKKFSSDFRLSFNEGTISYMTLFQEDKLILLVEDNLIIVNVFEKELIIKNKLNSARNNKIKIYDKNKIIVFETNFFGEILFFEFTENNYNYNLNNIGVIKKNFIDDIFIYNNNIFIYRSNIISMKKTDINIYSCEKNKCFQFETKILFNQHCKIINHPNGKKVGIFHMNQKFKIFLSELNKTYKIVNTFRLKGLYGLNLNDLAYKKIKSNNKTNNKFMISNMYGIFLFSSSNFQLIKAIKGFEYSDPKFDRIFITKVGDIYVTNNNCIYKLDLEDKNVIKDKYEFRIEKINNNYFNIFEKNKKIMIARGVDYNLYFYNINIPKYYIKRYLTFLIVSLILSSILIYLFFDIISYKFLLILHLMFLFDLYYDNILEITYRIYFILFFIYFSYSSIIFFGLLKTIGFIFIFIVILYICNIFFIY